MHVKNPCLLVVACVLALIPFCAFAEDSADSLPLLHPLFSDHGVLQRELPAPIWGWDEPGEEVTVTFGDQTHTAVADGDGKWMVSLTPLPASAEGRDLTVAGSGSTVIREDVLVGDVWIGSGQSNMQWSVSQSDNPDEEIANAEHPMIRLFTVPRGVAYEPAALVSAQWEICSPETIAGFSAVAYYFSRELHHELEVPIGLIHSSWGGTIAEAWTSAEALEALPDFSPHAEQMKILQSMAPGTTRDEAIESWHRQIKPGGNGNWRNDPNVGAVLYNAMIAPLLPYAIQGVIWYQGESNAGRAHQYRTLLPALIEDWRERFGAGDFGFHIVSLANYQDTSAEPRDHSWAELREAQAMTAQALPNTGIAMAIDIGEAGDIHPGNKQEVGHRLALSALAHSYGSDVEWSGPWYRAMRVRGNEIRLVFDHAGGGLIARGDKLIGFAIAGEDRKFVWADAEIRANMVIVSSPEVENPVAVRYAWDINPDGNLYNIAGLPAVPFRTDDWPMITQ
ncbi:MAG: sialate O-acetylesterase [Opitutales bacterium]